MKTLHWRTCSPERIAREIVELSTEHADADVSVYLRSGRITLRLEFNTRDVDHHVGTYDSGAKHEDIIHDITEAAFSEINQRRRAA